MKKTTLTLALISAGLISTPAISDGHDSESWVGGYGMYYHTDQGKPQPAAELDDGFGIGVEGGFRFSESWAARLSASLVDVDNTLTGDSEKGPLFGLDAMYFLQDDLFYVFGGIYHQNLDDTYNMLGYGLGKHWDIDDNVKLTSEIAAYRDIDDPYYDYSVKLGLAYVFGNDSSSSYTPTPAPKTMTSAPKDSDMDGVYDSKDQCPYTPSGTAVDSMGCSVDKDGDGVLNTMDQCPTTATGTPVDSKGCAIEPDTDADGVVDSQDACPSTPVGDNVHANGCTVFTEQEVSISVRILFANNSADISDMDDSQIVELAEFLQRYGSTNAVIEGHSSAPGAAPYNKDLSLRRANSLKALLVKQYGIEMSRLSTVGYGEERLLDTSNTRAAHNLNRRIEVKVSDTIEVPAK